MTDTILSKTIYLKAPKELVWDYLTQPEHLAKWFHAPKAPMKQGEKLEMFGTTSGDLLIWGSVITANKPDYLEYTFTVGPMGGAVSTVKWTLSDVPGGTQLSLEHKGLPQGADAISLIRVLYDHADETITALLAKIYATLPANGRLIVAEPMLGTRSGDAYFGPYCLAMQTGRTRSAAEIAEHLQNAGFSDVKVLKTSRPFVTGLVTARKV